MALAVAQTDPLLTVEEVAERLNVTKDWVWDHSSRKAPYLPVIRIGDGTLRYRVSQVEEFETGVRYVERFGYTSRIQSSVNEEGALSVVRIPMCSHPAGDNRLRCVRIARTRSYLFSPFATEPEE
jgi:predicted DNA-binding transcriptional regulator AlpA